MCLILSARVEKKEISGYSLFDQGHKKYTYFSTFRDAKYVDKDLIHITHIYGL